MKKNIYSDDKYVMHCTVLCICFCLKSKMKLLDLLHIWIPPSVNAVELVDSKTIYIYIYI